MKIAFLDLNHNSRGIHTNTVPLSSILIAAYTEKNVNHALDIKVFKEFDKAKKCFDNWIPDVVGMAMYSWNSELNLFACKLLKEKNPNLISIMGGPNLFLTNSLKEKFLKENRDVDICVSYDGEVPFQSIVQKLVNGETLNDLKCNPVPGTYSLNPNDDTFICSNEKPPKLRTLDGFGTIYSDGKCDEFLDNNFHPFLQTHRGCPFKCTFCHTGDLYYQKMMFMSPDLFKTEMEYLAERFKGKDHVTLYLANTNMSMFKEDFEIAEVIRESQIKYKWPKRINVNSGKDSNKLMKMTELINMRPAIALQTLSDNVLQNIKRRNIGFDAYMDFQKKAMVQTEGDSVSELILSLPEETKESFLKSLERVLNSGLQSIVIYTLMNLRGTALSSEESVKKYDYKIRHRVVPGQFTKTENDLIIDTEEVVVSTNTMPYEDYLFLRGLSFTITIFFSSAELRPLKRYLIESNISIYKWIMELHKKVKDHEKLSGYFNKFIEETEDELFSSHDEVLEFYKIKDNYKKLLKGELGDNLVRKYKKEVVFNCLQDCLIMAKEIAISLCAEKNIKNSKIIINDLIKYVSYRDIKKVRKNKFTETLNFDIPNYLINNQKVNTVKKKIQYDISFSDDIIEKMNKISLMNKDYDVSLQILYRDGGIRDFWPTWSKVD